MNRHSSIDCHYYILLLLFFYVERVNIENGIVGAIEHAHTQTIRTVCATVCALLEMTIYGSK